MTSLKDIIEQEVNIFLGNFCFDQMPAQMRADMIVFLRSSQLRLLQAVKDGLPGKRSGKMDMDSATFHNCVGWNSCREEMLKRLTEAL